MSKFFRGDSVFIGNSGKVSYTVVAVITTGRTTTYDIKGERRSYRGVFEQSLRLDKSGSKRAPLNHLVCDLCGKAFDVSKGLNAATSHEFQNHAGVILSGRHPLYTIKAESEAF